MSRRVRIIILSIIGIGIIGFVIFQLIPASSISAKFATPGNPPVTHTIPWDSPQTEQLARSACFDCHSNETRAMWYSNIAPVSWLVNKDVNEGRQKLNFSTGRHLEGDEMIEQIQKGAMPPAIYLPMHPEANLTAAQKQQLIDGLQATFGG
ncbi:MAG: heme-binding domain-containing protein [Chloroflexota bacterium]